MSKHGIDFDKPPVIEVACSIGFMPLVDFAVPHVGLLWERFQEELPFCKEMPPLPEVRIEPKESPPIQPQPEIKLLTGIILPRIWFFNADETNILQLQRDRLAYSWKKSKESDAYPRFESVYERFSALLAAVRGFLKDSGMSDIQPVQYELIYINRIPRGSGWSEHCDAGKVFNQIALGAKQSGFLPPVEAYSMTTQFLMPDGSGRLYAVIQSAIDQAREPLVQFNLTARGIDASHDISQMSQWFELGREWIVKGFVELTGKDTQQEVWKKR